MYQTSLNKLTEYREVTEAVKTHRFICEEGYKMSKIYRSSLFYLEVGGSTFLQNISKHLTVYLASFTEDSNLYE
jgi:hypothetical protein